MAQPTMKAGQAQTPKTVICTGTRKMTGQLCQAELDAEAEFCGKCGTPVPKLRVCTGKKKNGNPCEFRIPEDCDYCPKCGTEVPGAEEEVPRRDYCTGTKKDGTPCKAELNPDQEFCGKCGTPRIVDTDAVAEPESSSQGAQKDPPPADTRFQKPDGSVQQPAEGRDDSTTPQQKDPPPADTRFQKPDGSVQQPAEGRDGSTTPQQKGKVEEQRQAELVSTDLPGNSSATADKKTGNTFQMASQRDVQDEHKKGAASTEAPELYADVVKPGAQKSPNKVTEPKQTEEGNTTLGSVTGMVNVVFIVIISEQFSYKPDVDKAFVRLGPSFEEAHSVLLEFVRATPVGHMVQGTVPMSKEERNKGFEYKYIVHTYDSKKGKFELHWEHLQTAMFDRGVIVNRHLRVPEKDKHTSGDYKRYDGIVYPKQSRSGEFFKTYMTGRYKSDAQAAGEEYLPSADEISRSLLCPTMKPERTAESYLDDIQYIMFTMPYPMTVGKVVDQDSKLVSGCVEKKLVRPLLEIIRTQLADQENAIRTTTLAMFLLLLTEKLQVKMENMKNVNMLCRAMLVTADMSTQTVPEIDHLKAHFPVMMQDKKKMVEHVQRLIHMSGDPAADCSWLCCVPLLHFLEDLSTPFRALTPSKNYKAHHGEWWGITSFEDRKKSFKKAWSNKSENDMGEILDMVAKLEPLFAADALLSRSVVACLDYGSLLTVLLKFNIPIEVIGATLAFNIHHRGRTPQSKEIQTMLLRVIRRMPRVWKESGDRFSEEHLKLTRCQVHLVRDQFSIILGKNEYFDHELTLCMIRVMFGGLDRLAQEEDYVCKETSQLEWQQQATEVCKTACQWNNWNFGLCISPYAQNRNEKLSAVVKAWIKLLQQTKDLRHGELKKSCEATISGHFETALNKISPKDKLAVYLRKRQVLPSILAEILSRQAFESLEQAFLDQATFITAEISKELSSLLSDLLERKWMEAVPSEMDAFTFTVTWPFMINYLNMPQKASIAQLSNKAQKIITEAMESISTAMDSLCEGSIQISQLKFLSENEQRFFSVTECTGVHKTNIAALLRLRKHELEAYETNSNHVEKLFEYCQEYLKTGDANEVKERIDQLRCDAHTLLLSDVSEVAPNDGKTVVDRYRPKANPWKLPEDVLSVLPEFERQLSSKIFCKLFSTTAAEKQPELMSTTFWRAFLILWTDVKKEWDMLCEKMIGGSITLAETERIFRMFTETDGSHNFGEISDELSKIAGSRDKSWVEDRITQFKCFTEIKQHVEAAHVMLQLKEVYQMSGGFDDIEKIFNLGQNEGLAIRNMDQSVRDLCTQFEGLSPYDINCLKDFLEPRCQQFVSWVRETMKGGLKELKVFVDLAFISAGEEPYAVDSVNCFHTTAIGYAPLIFMNGKDKDFTYLMEQIRLVFNNIKDDSKLPKKLADISPKLEWFQDVQKSHGSVEKTAMTQVGNINARGVFKIGSVKSRGMDVHSVIQLDVSEDVNGAKPPRRYTYSELLDLQSRLMLVAGQAEKGKEDVDRFITIMDSMVRLGKKYVQLCEDGCILFLEWSVNFLCDKSTPVCCTSEFSGDEMLKGHRSKQDLEDFIAGVAAFLEKCHTEWMNYVDRKRREYPEFNLFIIKQLVFLQQELVKVGTGDVSKLLYPLLSLVKVDCTPDDVEWALDEAMDEVVRMKQKLQGQQQQIQQQEEEKRETKEKIGRFLKELKEADIPRHKALRALDAVGPDDPDEGIVWCMENDCEEEEDDADNEGQEEGEEEKKQVGKRLTELVLTHQSIADSAVEWLQQTDTGEDTLQAMIGNLSLVWKKFLESVSSGFKDFLSLEHLGLVLRSLASRDQRRVKRILPPVFESGTPNLMLCPKTEVLNVVTYMYMFPEDSSPPLPQPDEVLLCTETTPFEQVDIFLRRTFFDTRHEKVHCLAFADSLAYDVGEMTEKRIKEYDSQTENDYHLVVICTSENEYRSHVVAALDRYHRPASDIVRPEQVCEYLTQRFSGVVKKDGKDSASSLDPQSLSVRVVRSNRSGVGKTLYKQRLSEQLRKRLGRRKRSVSVSIPLHCRVADMASIAALLLEHTLEPVETLPRIIHLDISYQVLEGVDHLLYNLLVLGCVSDDHGKVWLRSPMDLYIVETMPLYDQQRDKTLVHQIFHILPSLKCWSPQDSLTIMRDRSKIPAFQEHDRLFDEQQFGSEMYQRPYHYLQALEHKQQPTIYQPCDPPGQKEECLAILMKYCGVNNPSWSELTHFVSFLNKQLRDFEFSVYCNMAAEDLPHFSTFVLRFVIQMSRDFATRSLNVSEQSLAALETLNDHDETNIDQYQMRRTWETSPHPYIFFNPDGHTMTFLGFSIDSRTGDLMDQQTGKVLEKKIVSRELFRALKLNRVPLTEDFDALPRSERLRRLYRVFGVEDDEMMEDVDGKPCIIDPDVTYELTTDNVKKILAIYMRFRCNIPVIVMGETGCGKTRLVKFLCALQTPRQKTITTMVLVKVHGGTTASDIVKKVKQAEKVARRNAAEMLQIAKKKKPEGHAENPDLEHSRPIYTVLFFDEANTTEAVGAIKEVMCDGTMNGQPITLDKSLKMVACCNPYRKHSDQLIERLENAGLGYHVDADKTVDKLGRVPMRHLVYRVQPLPQSMLPLVWDFGQLNPKMEELYIKQMVRRYVTNKQLPALCDAGLNVLCQILVASQEFMRSQKDECSFVSLRDVDRALTVASWFYMLAEKEKLLFMLLETILKKDKDKLPERAVIALVLSLGVCYRACLGSKTEHSYDLHITQFFTAPLKLPGGRRQFQNIINKCQDILLDNVRLEENIARNQALKENVFMMVVCIELRIPLFLVGKPGSSKSLAKTIVSDAMQGTSAHKELFRQLKQAQMVSFQCSPLATAEGIQSMFRQCARYQKNKNMDAFVSVVVLDEVGLAEDSPKMALKTLHPLLEDGYSEDDTPEETAKVAFVGISNWALDPAKMNRALLVQRDVPSEEELLETARGICNTKDETTSMNVRPLIPKLAEAYLAIFKKAKQKREFFGLRDFYSLVKMVYAFAASTKKPPSQRQLIASIRRNFGGLDSIDAVELFQTLIPAHRLQEQPCPDDPDCSSAGLITAALKGDDMGGESRYLLLLTENYGGLSILTERLLANHRVVPIFGSSFPRDQEYTKICTNINRIKVCMETGQTVILLNLENLYESLYDALNQYYAMLGGERYVDLGLGTHRVKCRVHRQFRLIVVAEKHMVYDKFPIPLINRLEKHFLTVNNIMTPEQLEVASQLEQWAADFVKTTPRMPVHHMAGQGQEENKLEETVGDVFMGYHLDTAPAIVLKAWDTLQIDQNPDASPEVLPFSQDLLLWCATPDAVVRSRDEQWNRVYHDDQQHEHLAQYLQHRLQQQPRTVIIAQVTTHCRMLTETERLSLCDQLQINVTLLSLQAFETEQQFNQQLRVFFSDGSEGDKLLLVQCDSGDVNQNLFKCAQYCVQDQMPVDATCFHVVFIIQLPRIAGGCFTGFLGGSWHCLHIDELRTPKTPLPSATLLESLAPSMLIAPPITKTKGVLDAADVELEVQEEAQEWEQPQGFSPQYVRELLTSCVQAAVALVDKRGSEHDARATRRIKVMLTLMKENDEFAAGIHKMVWNILKKKEERLANAERWLSREAARLDSVQKAGTFRQAWVQCLEKKVTPVLAGIVAYLDSCDNLDHLHHILEKLSDEEISPTWTERAWLSVLQDVCNVNYEELRSTGDKHDLEEFTVACPAAENVPFACKFPFPWIVWELVNKAISEARVVKDDILKTAGSVVEQSALGQCLQKAVGQSEEHMEQMFCCYISDLLLFVFKLSCDEHKLFQQCIQKALQQVGMNLTQLEVGRGLVALHLVLDHIKPRLLSILDMNDRRPSSVADLMKSEAGARLLAIPDEMTEDVALLLLLLEDLRPDPEAIKHKDGIREWTGKFSKVAPAIVRILSSTSYLANPPAIQDGQAGVQGSKPEVKDATPPEDSLVFGKECRKQLKVARSQWMRILAVKLFMDYMNPLRCGPEMTRKALKNVSLPLLWKALASIEKEEHSNNRQLEAFKAIDRFLKHANNSMIKGLLGEVTQCIFCERDLTNGPVELPCKHRICQGCYINWCPKDRPGQCPRCRMVVPIGFDPTDCEYGDAVEQLRRYQRQTSGFLMALVTQLCFGGHEAPQPEAVKHIISQYIMHEATGKTLIETKHMTVQDDIVDPTPVLRTFLMRLLLKYKEQEVKDLLQNNLLKKYKKLIDQQEQQQTEPRAGTRAVVEFSILVIFCVEDLLHEKEAALLGNQAEFGGSACLRHLADILHNLRPAVLGPAMEMTTLESLGQLRYALDALARVLYVLFLDCNEEPTIIDDLKELLRVAQEICQTPGVTWAKKFLIKQLCRDHGIQAYMDLVKTAEKHQPLQWISLKEFVVKVEIAPDMFLTTDEAYQTIRDNLQQIQYNGDSTQLMNILQGLEMPAQRKETLLLLSLHRVATMARAQKLPEQQLNQMTMDLDKLVDDCDAILDKDTGHRLLRGKVWSKESPLFEAQSVSAADQSLENILVQFRLTLGSTAKSSRLLGPFHALAFNPMEMKNTLLPTMPQDDLAELFKVIKKDPQYGEAVIWRCSCGYRFVVGECGRVVMTVRCKKCGKEIGAREYGVPLEGTTRDSGNDETKTGHILGNAKQRSTQGLPERQLSVLECSFTRFFTHAALFIGANIPDQTDVLSAMVEPRIADKDLCQFFWDHMKKDVKVLQEALGHTAEDVCILLHHICTTMAHQQQDDQEMAGLASKEEREKWEREFANAFLAESVKGTETIIAQGRKMIVADAGKDQTELLNMVHELDEDTAGQERLDQLLTYTAVWRYRPHINVDHFFRQFQLQVESHRDMDNTYPVIRLFKKESHILRALHYVPAILAGQRRLMNQLHRRLDRAEALALTIGQVKNKKACKGLPELLWNFSKAWEIVKERLILHACLTPLDGLVNLPDEFHNVKISEDSPLAVLLPATSGPGLCSYVLLQYLLKEHNNFMEKYCTVLKHSGPEDWYTFKSLPEVSARNIRERHLVSYTPELLLPLVLANCNYSLTVGQSATLEYDFETFQKQLQDSILGYKSRVSRHQSGYIEIDTMVYKVDITSSRLFKTVRDRIPQEALSPAQRRQIKDDFRGQLPAICQSIDNLNTALSFLKALGGDPFLSLHEFMNTALQMKTTILSRKAQQLVSLKHIQSLWVFLCFERASILAAHRQDAFDIEGQELRAPLEKGQELELETMCKRMSAERLELLVLQIFECIMLRLSQPRDQDDDTNAATCKLRDELIFNLSDCPFYNETPAEIRSGMLTADDLMTREGSFPESLLGRHAIHTWLVCRKQLALKHQ